MEKRQSSLATNKLAKKNLAKVYGKANFTNVGLPPKSATGMSRNKKQQDIGSYSKFHLQQYSSAQSYQVQDETAELEAQDLFFKN